MLRSENPNRKSSFSNRTIFLTYHWTKLSWSALNSTSKAFQVPSFKNCHDGSCNPYCALANVTGSICNPRRDQTSISFRHVWSKKTLDHPGVTVSGTHQLRTSCQCKFSTKTCRSGKREIKPRHVHCRGVQIFLSDPGVERWWKQSALNLMRLWKCPLNHQEARAEIHVKLKCSFCNPHKVIINNRLWYK